MTYSFVTGDIRIEISNRRGEYISKLPGSQQKKLFVELKLTLHGMLHLSSICTFSLFVLRVVTVFFLLLFIL